MNNYAKAVMFVLSGLVAALSVYIYDQPNKAVPAKIDSPRIIGKISNQNGGGVVDIFEMAGTPASVFCVVAVSSSVGSSTLYPVVSCLKK